MRETGGGKVEKGGDGKGITKTGACVFVPHTPKTELCGHRAATSTACAQGKGFFLPTDPHPMLYRLPT